MTHKRMGGWSALLIVVGLVLLGIAGSPIPDTDLAALTTAIAGGSFLVAGLILAGIAAALGAILAAIKPTYPAVQPPTGWQPGPPQR